MKSVAIALLVLGSLVSGLNFYLSFVRVPLHRRLRPETPTRNVSGFPLVGSACLWLSMVLLGRAHVLFLPALAISFLDTGGIHWFLASQFIRRPRGHA
jgi:fructose-1,6-bisphosphatase/inositol monophosphatase family enzyme